MQINWLRIVSMLLLLCGSGAVHAAQINASVDSINGSEIIMLIEGALDPNPGDSVMITYSGFDDDAEGTAAGEVVFVETGTGKARARIGVQGGIELWPGLRLVINSAAPKERGSSANDDWMQSLEGIEGLALPPGDPFYTSGAGNGTIAQGSSADINPSDPAVAGLIMEWIGNALPLQNAKPGYELRYSQWAQLVGKTATGIITINAKPDDAAAYAEPALYLWDKHQTLGSLNLCTLGEYVRSKSQGLRVDNCTGDGGSGRLPAPTLSTRVNESEPNANATQAEDLPLNSRVTGTISPRYDQDWFKMQPVHHGEMAVKVTGQPSGLGVRLSAHPEGGNWLAGVDGSDEDNLIVDLATPIPHYLRVDSAVNSESDAPYQLDVSFKRSPDIFEPNPNANNASAIPLSGGLVGTILPRYDQDWFVLDPSQHGELTIDVAQEPAHLGTRLAIHPRRGNWIADIAPNENGKLVVDVGTPTPHFLRVDSSTNERSVDPYILSMNYRPSPDLFEPNPDANSATKRALNGELIGTILPRYDQDWFELSPKHHGELTLSITQEPDHLGTRLAVHPAGGNWLKDVSANDDGKLVVDLAMPVPHFFRVDSAKNERSVEPYKLSMVFRPSADKFEPNPNANSAWILPLNGSVIGTILPRYDQDWFELKPAQHGELTVTIAAGPQNLGTRLAVHPEGGNWISDLSPADDNKFIVDFASPITHYFRVDSSSNQRSIEPYQLSMIYRESVDIFEPNSSAKEAKSIPISGDVFGTILPRYDQDWFELNPTQHGELTIEIAGAPQDLGTRLAVHPAGGNWIADESPSELDKIVIDVATPIQHFLRVDSAKNERSIEPYKLSMSYRASVDTFEPNPNADESKPLPPGIFTGTILPRYDQDWFSFSAVKGNQIVVLAQSGSDDLGLRISVHPAGGNWLSNKSVDTPGKMIFDAPKSGVYFLRVDSAKNQRSIEPYSVSLSAN